jgi:(1->4)-alpha-D-glucan 1-alpha-D-glucosylmutase
MRSIVDGNMAPTASLEYLFYQSLVAAWPIGWDGGEGRDAFAKRMVTFVLKAAREAKQETRWTNPNGPYDDEVRRFVADVLDDPTFLLQVSTFSQLIDVPSVVNSLSQTVLKLTAPGIPDTYQGAELWNQSLVDPDNRRPVDFAQRRKLLGFVMERWTHRDELLRELLATYETGALKLFVTRALLFLRREKRELFLRGDYDPVLGGDHVVAFMRTFGEHRLVTVVPRWSASLTSSPVFPIGDAWGERRIRLPHRGSYRDVFTGKTRVVSGPVRLRELFADFPVSVLIAERGTG